MKKYFILATMLILFFGNAHIFALTKPNADCIVIMSPNFNALNSTTGKCGSPGSGCIVAAVTEVVISAHQSIDNAYLVTIEFLEIASMFGNDVASCYQHNILKFKFPENFRLKIEKCADFPHMEGTILDLSGMEMNGTNSLTLQIVRDN